MSIEISVVIWTIISFAALYYVLKFLLFKPIISFMDNRNARIKAGFQARESALSEKDECRRLGEEEVKEAHARAKGILAEVREQDDEKRRVVLENARRLAAGEAEAIDTHARQDEQTDISSLIGEMPELVYVLAGSILQDEDAARGCEDIIAAAVAAEYK